VRDLVCARCGRGFGCGVDDEACWCAELTLARPVPPGYDDCLCPECLAELVQPAPEAAGALDVRTQRPHAPGERRV
jgi:hypothetical protein